MNIKGKKKLSQSKMSNGTKNYEGNEDTSDFESMYLPLKYPKDNRNETFIKDFKICTQDKLDAGHSNIKTSSQIQEENTNLCTNCNYKFNKKSYSVRCSTCIKWYCLSCTNISKKEITEFKKFKKEWICINCEKKSNQCNEIKSKNEINPTTTDMDKQLLIEIKLIIQKEIQGLEEKIKKKFDEETRDLKKSIEYMAGKFEEQRQIYEKCIIQNKTILKENQDLIQKVQKLENKTNIRDQMDKKNNILITGIAIQNNSNVREVVSKLITGMGAEINKEDIIDCYRIKTDKEDKPIVIKLKTYEAKRKIFQRRKIIRSISTKECNFQGPNKRIYFNDELTKFNQDLFKAVREFKIENQYKSAYCINGRIYLKKNEDSIPMRIYAKENLHKARL